MPWHQILHSWNRRVLDFSERFHLQCWSETCLRHTGNSLRTLQVCHPEPGSDVFWNGFQLALVWADHQTLGAHNWTLLLGSWDGKIGRLMPNIPEIGNMHVMLLLILQSNDVQCLKSSACATNSNLEFRSAPAPLRGDASSVSFYVLVPDSSQLQASVCSLCQLRVLLGSSFTKLRCAVQGTRGSVCEGKL